MNHILLAIIMFHVRFLLMVLFSLCINFQARGYANISGKATRILVKKHHYTIWDKVIMLDVYNHAKANAGWVCIFFYENILVLICYSIANIFATVWEIMYGQTSVMGYSLIGMYGLLNVHVLLFFIPDELFNYEWREKRRSGRKKRR